jgi:hypothetical protein
MLEEVGNVANFEIVEKTIAEDGTMHRRVECTTTVELPAMVKRVVGDGSYTEIGTFDSVHKNYSAHCVPKLGAERFSTRFEVSARPIGAGERCERVIVTENTIKVFGIGGVLESVLERFQREGHTRTAEFINAWLRRSSPIVRTG